MYSNSIYYNHLWIILFFLKIVWDQMFSYWIGPINTNMYRFGWIQILTFTRCRCNLNKFKVIFSYMTASRDRLQFQNGTVWTLRKHWLFLFLDNILMQIKKLLLVWGILRWRSGSNSHKEQVCLLLFHEMPCTEVIAMNNRTW